MNKFSNIENLKNKLEVYKIEDEKNKYIFRANLRYIISSSIFFIIIVIIAGYSLYKGVAGIEKLNTVKIAFIVILFGYSIVASFLLFSFKIIIEDNKIFLKKIIIKIEDIESASVKIIRVSPSKADKFLEIITKDKKRIQIRLNINNELLFLKLIQNQIGEKMDI
nr:hypothetical protein [uncultured Leptotrichia sp.]